MSQQIVFEKMHGIGNDFVLIDNRKQNIVITSELVVSLGNRHTGIGFDQLLVIDNSEINNCHAAYRFYNPDGSQAEQCGNGQRCISKYLHMKNPDVSDFCISGLSGLIHSWVLTNGDVCVNMGQIVSIDTLHINNQSCYQVDFGNPHLVTVINKVETCDLLEFNNQMTRDFSDGVNFEVVEIINRDEIKIRVRERGTGETLACGSGACASFAALASIEKLNNRVKVILVGGNLMVEYQKSSKNILLTGPAIHVFTGEIKI